MFEQYSGPFTLRSYTLKNQLLASEFVCGVGIDMKLMETTVVTLQEHMALGSRALPEGVVLLSWAEVVE